MRIIWTIIFTILGFIWGYFSIFILIGTSLDGDGIDGIEEILLSITLGLPGFLTQLTYNVLDLLITDQTKYFYFYRIIDFIALALYPIYGAIIVNILGRFLPKLHKKIANSLV